MDNMAPQSSKGDSVVCIDFVYIDNKMDTVYHQQFVIDGEGIDVRDYGKSRYVKIEIFSASLARSCILSIYSRTSPGTYSVELDFQVFNIVLRLVKNVLGHIEAI